MAELIGYAASALVALSLLTSNVLRLRVLNLAGALAFVLYGALVKAWPVFAVNLFVAGIDLWHIIALKSKKDVFRLMPVGERDPLLSNFLSYHARGIWQYFPDFDLSALRSPRCVFILRNLLPVGLFVYTEEGTDVRVHLDYVSEDYRDLKSARFLFNSTRGGGAFVGFATFTAAAASEKHAAYLRKMGFEEEAGRSGFFRRKI
ncbi:MAG: hypothetical protein M0011_07645 [Elusimicrobia bacterium]|nr:hypothetical protein [Elusimicrobiota bacterium]